MNIRQARLVHVRTIKPIVVHHMCFSRRNFRIMKNWYTPTHAITASSTTEIMPSRSLAPTTSSKCSF